MNLKNKPNEIYINRIYDAPVKKVWDAWIDPQQVAQWWGPRGFTLTSQNKDVQPGGKWIYTMHGPDGVDYPNITLFHEVEKYSRLVYDHGANENQPALFRVTVNFTELNGQTHMDMTMALETAEKAQEIKKFIKLAQGDSTWDRLAEFLSQQNENKDIFVTHRSFEAPLEKVWETWTNPKHFSQWLAPTGFSMETISGEIKPSEILFYSMGNKDFKMYGQINYKEIKKPTHLIYTQIFCDKDGKVSRHSLSPTWPETMLTKISFHAEGESQTRIRIQWDVFGEASAIERQTFHDAKAGMTLGWSGSFDKLEDYLKTI